MGLVIPIGIAKALIQWIAFWGAFKALKVPKTRRKIPRLNFRRNESASVTVHQAQSSSDSLTSAQKLRRTQIKAMTKMCLVWVVWTRIQLIVDWIAWAIPFYDEIHLAILIMMIVMGPTGADFFFRHIIKRVASPYERTFDAILGTIHDVLVITIYILTSGPKYLYRQYENWKARQFNKSLLSARAAAPPTRLPSLQSFRFPANRSSATLATNTLHLKPSIISQDHSTQPDSSYLHSRRRYPSLAPRQTHRGTSQEPSTLKVPQRKPTLSRKLSSTYRRSVSNSSMKSALDHRASCTLPKKHDVRVLENRLESKTPLATAHLNTLREPKPMIFGNSNLINVPPIQPTIRSSDSHFKGNQYAVNFERHTDLSMTYESSEDQHNSIIIHDDCSEPADSTGGFTWPSTQSVQPQSRKRSLRPDEEPPLPMSGTVLDGLAPQSDGSSHIIRRPFQYPHIQIESPSRPQSDSPNDVDTSQAPPNKRQKVALSISSDGSGSSSKSNDASDSMVIKSLVSHERPGSNPHGESGTSDTSIWRSAPNAALPMPDETLSPTKVPPPTTKRRLHGPDEPLPVYQTDELREKALGSIRALPGVWDFPTSESSPQSGKLNSRLNGLRQAISKSGTSPHRRPSDTQPTRKTSTSQVKKSAQVPNGKPTSSSRKVSTSTKPRPISGKLGQERALKTLDKRTFSNSLDEVRKVSGPILSGPSRKPSKSNSVKPSVTHKTGQTVDRASKSSPSRTAI
ncbi:hypothetical protein CROQUDRAFT_40378 [Cronartium quercuum f. sp. fusiforme G11]|uniref:Uncharacterized protein n=1 Tax=Cronartium quercuum f. sp. fusiforme G11 TaxID=708437 RepID=A0A9P6NN32_9BASI|nr:hypothetical protein CROQUDRAFT_40378 [Cronartium quercuum f. sp. fusiforme G11]